MDTSKKQQAIEMIAAQIANIPANIQMPFGTAGYQSRMTKREGEAASMAKYIVTRMGGKFSGALPENYTDEERESASLVKEIAASAIEKAGK